MTARAIAVSILAGARNNGWRNGLFGLKRFFASAHRSVLFVSNVRAEQRGRSGAPVAYLIGLRAPPLRAGEHNALSGFRFPTLRKLNRIDMR
jgi:hypothetical protein